MARCAPGRFELVLLDPPFDAGLSAPACRSRCPCWCEAAGSTSRGGTCPLDHCRRAALHRGSVPGAVHAHSVQGYTEPRNDLEAAP
jgi:16S rRNA (guanine966-N2)-methyltransferase